MRIVFWMVCALALLAGLLFGALNGNAVSVDLYFEHLVLPLGGALLGALLLGAVLAGLCLWLSVILPLRTRLRRLQRQSLSPQAIEPTADLA